jgi:hypothetical protein
MYGVGSLQRATQRLTPFMDLIRSKKNYLKALRSFMNLEQELIALESFCQSGIESIKHLGLRFNNIDLWHVFSPEVPRPGKISGCHKIMKGPMRKIVKNLQKVEGTSIYTCSLECGKDTKNFNTLFPPEWSRVEILEKLFEACRNYPIKGKVIPSSMQNQKIIESFTNSGMKIKMVIKNGSLRSFYPILD